MKKVGVSYCVCQNLGKDGTTLHSEQSRRRFCSASGEGRSPTPIIQPCENHASCYAAKGARHNWREIAPAPTTRLKLAKQYQRKIAKLQRERERLYKQALRELKLLDTTLAFDWFFNDQQGHNSFTESLK